MTSPELAPRLLLSAEPAGLAEPDSITFYAPGLKPHRTSEFTSHDPAEFVSISVTGTACALNCDHCGKQVLRGMTALPRTGRSLFELCAQAADRGARGVLVSGGCDARGRVPLGAHVADLARVRSELGLRIRVHPGLPDDETCAALATVGLDGAMMDIIGDESTIREVYHLDAVPEDYERALANLGRNGVPAVPHIVLGLHRGQMRGEWRALEMIARNPMKLLVLVILMPLNGTPMARATPPTARAIGEFFRDARSAVPERPIVLGCARPLGPLKNEVDRLAVDAGLDGIAYPAEGTVAYARSRGKRARFVNACCGVSW